MADDIIGALSRNIASIESGGWKNPYEALGPVVKGRGQAIGKYQVMPENVPGWTQAALGHSLTPDQFKASPEAQEAVFRDQMQRSLKLYSPKDAASIWFTGRPYKIAGGAATDSGTTNANYVARATAGIGDNRTFTPGPATAVAAAPTTPNAAALTAPTFGEALKTGNVGDMIKAAITKPPAKTDDKGNEVEQKSPLEKLAGNLGGVVGGQQAAPQIPEMHPAPVVQDPMMGMAQPAAQLYAATAAAAAKPLTWGIKPYGSNAGFQGTTLNATDYNG